jgi:outer membrane protein assembly factor BamD
MMLSYTQLDQPQLADDTKRVLAATFPDSPYITGKSRPGTESKAWYQIW